VRLSYHPELTPTSIDIRNQLTERCEVEILYAREEEAKCKEFVGLLAAKPYYARYGFNLKPTI
jgi:hypothetical protein